jgi:hypothetical protein
MLNKIREDVTARGLSLNRLPKWVRSSRVRIGEVGNSTIFLFEDSNTNSDVFKEEGRAKSDVQFILNLPGGRPRGYSLDISRKFEARMDMGVLVLEGEYEPGTDKLTIFNIPAEDICLTNAGYTRYHIPIALVNILLKLTLQKETLASRFVPLAIVLNRHDVSDIGRFIEKNIPNIVDSLATLHDSKYGAQLTAAKDFHRALQTTKEKSVIVLGSYGLPEANLMRVREYLLSRKYEAWLLKELPEVPSMSLEEKCRTWCGASKFCVIVDEVASGHIAEYGMLKSQRTIIALIRREGECSTHMIGDEGEVDYNFIRVFEFRNDPLEVIDSVIDWAEELTRKRIIAYGESYPWRPGKVNRSS